MTPFYAHPLRRLMETSDAAATSVRTLSDQQLRSERESLRKVCAVSADTGPATLLMVIYDSEIARRGIA